jgi:hypothetical protein
MITLTIQTVLHQLDTGNNGRQSVEQRASWLSQRFSDSQERLSELNLSDNVSGWIAHGRKDRIPYQGLACKMTGQSQQQERVGPSAHCFVHLARSLPSYAGTSKLHPDQTTQNEMIPLFCLSRVNIRGVAERKIYAHLPKSNGGATQVLHGSVRDMTFAI